jgi:molybdopterin-guanine dinucleotide biosynthesis protein B
MLFPDDPHIVALVTDAGISTVLPTFGLEDYAGIADFMLKHLGLG